MSDQGALAFATPLTSFIGRTAAIDEVSDLLERHRLVTLTGPGGCGKTRLAIAVADRLAPSVPDGVAFVDLAPVESSALVAAAVASATGVPESGGVALSDLLATALAERRILLLVDNCERVLDGTADVVQTLIGRCPHLTVLATSRSPLGVAGEVTWRVPSLAVPPLDVDPQAALASSEAGQLLTDRARLSNPELTFSDDEAAAAVAVCRRLDGLPLAIELAAGRLRALDIRTLAADLDRRFGLLSGGPRTAPPRHQTLEASIDWSHDLLSPPERTLFRRLAVFAGSFTVDAAERVGAGDDMMAAGIRTVLAELVDRSLLQIDDRHGGGRYRLLEPVRNYALTRLAESGEESAVRDRHLDHLLELSAWFDSVAEGPDVEAACQRMEPVIDDIRIALDWSVRSDRVPAGLTLAADLRLFWILRNRHLEGAARLVDLLKADTGEDPRARTRALGAAVQLGLYDVNPSRLVELAAEAIGAARDLGDPWLEGRALMLAGWVHQYTDPDEAKSLLIAARAMTDLSGDRRGFQNASYGLGGVATAVGDLGLARDALAGGIAAADPNAKVGVRVGLTMLGYVEILQGRLREGRATLEDALSRMPPGLDRHNRDEVVTYLAVALAYQGFHDEARRRFTEAIASLREIGNPSGSPLMHLGLLELGLGDYAAAVARIEEARPMLERLGLPWQEIQALVCLGHATAALGDTSAATSSWQDAADRADATGNPLARSVACMGQARGAVLAGDVDGARTLLRNALRAAVGAEYRLGAIDALEGLAVLEASTRSSDAGLLLAAVDSERERVGYVRFPVVHGLYEEARATITAPVGAVSFAEGLALALGDRTAAARPSSGWESLSPAEERVAQLVVEGLTNPEIGERLFISRRTVQAHLSRVFTKLGVANRAELASFITRSIRTSGS